MHEIAVSLHTYLTEFKLIIIEVVFFIIALIHIYDFLKFHIRKFR